MKPLYAAVIINEKGMYEICGSNQLGESEVDAHIHYLANPTVNPVDQLPVVKAFKARVELVACD